MFLFHRCYIFLLETIYKNKSYHAKRVGRVYQQNRYCQNLEPHICSKLQTIILLQHFLEKTLSSLNNLPQLIMQIVSRFLSYFQMFSRSRLDQVLLFGVCAPKVYNKINLALQNDKYGNTFVSTCQKMGYFLYQNITELNLSILPIPTL